MSRPSKWIVIAGLFAGLGVCMIISLFVFGVVEEKPKFVTSSMQQIRSWSAFLKPASIVKPNDPLEFDINMIDIAQEKGVWLSGFPSYATFEMPLPRDSNVGELVLNLVGEKDVSPDVVVALRVGVNGQRVMDRLLSPGKGTVQYQFIVPEEMRRASKLAVSIQLHGDVSGHVCHNERSSGAVFTVLPQSGVVGRLDSPLMSVRDVVEALPQNIDIAIDDDKEEPAVVEAAFRLGLRLSQNGYTVTYIKVSEVPIEVRRGRRSILFARHERLLSEGFVPTHEGKTAASASVWHRNGTSVLAVTKFDDVAVSRFLTSAIVPLASQPIAAPRRVKFHNGLGKNTQEVRFAALGVDTDVARISAKRTWRVGYSLADMPDGHVPTAVNLNLQLPAGPDDVTYTLHTELNGVLIASRKLLGAALNKVSVPLPVHAHNVRNSLNVTLQRHARDGGCAVAHQKYPVQLLDSSALVFAQQSADLPHGFVDMPRKLHQGVEVRVPVSAFATRTEEALNVLTPIVASFLPFDVEPDFRWVPVEADHEKIPDRPFVALWHVPPGTSSHVVVQLDQRLIKASNGRIALDLDQANNITTVQAVSARRDDPFKRGAFLVEHGLVIQSAGRAPMAAGIDYSQEDALAIFDDGEAIVIDRRGLVERGTRIRAGLDHE